MIEINLIPAADWQTTFRKKFNVRLPYLPLIPIIGGLFIGVFLLQATMNIMVGFKDGRLRRLKEQYQGFAGIEGDGALSDEIRSLGMRLNEFTRLTKREYDVAQKLNCISDALMPGMWLTELSFAEKTSLILRGNSLPNAGEQDTVQIGAFIAALKKNPEFMKGFEEVALDSLHRVTYGKKEIVNFVIICRAEVKEP